ncbi:MAG: sodium-translocating pyrophosphatase [Oscillospiraceae bacterium]|nr:sodium-translocating pyrophosphatase [Oscillospiraceae bacterium]
MDSPALMLLAPIGAVAALLFAVYLFFWMKRQDEGTDEMKKISASIRQGANAFIKRQYTTAGIFFIGMTLLLGVLAYFGFLTIFVPFAFITGAFFSGLAGLVGMKAATYANSRTANACRSSLNRGLRVAFNSGAVMGMTVVGLGVLDIAVWYYFLQWWYSGPGLQDVLREAVALGTDELSVRLQYITSAMITFGMGASSMALFARVGGGIFTKAADVGADLVGKVEAGIPEDDPRNPATIADNVGDNVGDVCGMGADLYESYVGSIVATCSLGVAAFIGDGKESTTMGAVAIPIIMAAIGILASILGTFLVRTGENASQSKLLGALRRGVYGSSAIIAVVSFFLVREFLGADKMGIYWAILLGLVAGNVIGFLTEYYTSDAYKPTKELAASAKTGSATLIIGGISLGMMSTFFPALVAGATIIGSFIVANGFNEFSEGMYAVAISAVGMLSTLGITLATDAYGPIADNAGGIAEMSALPKQVRERTDALDSLGNTTAATGKGFCIGAAALTALALMVSYIEQIGIKISAEVQRFAETHNLDAVTDLDKITGMMEAAGEKIRPGMLDLSITNPPVMVGLFIGAALAFTFAALLIKSVNRAAQGIVREVRRQFKEITGLMEGKAEADYASCVDICTKNALREMILPSVLAIVIPIAVGFFLGVNGVAGMLAGGLVTGFALAFFVNNSGGAWDNAKKYIEAGNLDGKGSNNHKAAVVGDTVGDPFKDTAGPAVDILIKLMSMVSIVFAAFVMSVSIM